ncbi:hypothetical protein D3C76_1605270 [compost metagenome]
MVRKKPTALWPYHHCTMASVAPAYREYDLKAVTGISMLLTTCSRAVTRMKPPKNQLPT